MSDCVFCKIAAKEIPSNIIYEDDYVIAFLDNNPGVEGHSLVIPKQHFEQLTDMDEESISKTFSAVARVSKALRNSLGVPGIGLYQNNGSSAGQVVMHMHVHVVPRKEGDGFAFNRFSPSREELTQTAEKIRSGF